jgi:nucleoside-triphosphatase
VGPLRLLLIGRPTAGKTTVVRRLLELLAEAGRAPAGFVTAEVREGGERVGFVVRDVATGVEARIADVTWTGGERVGRYGVDVAAFEAVALPALGAAHDQAVLVVDEIARMELLSPAFVACLDDVLERPGPVVATLHSYAHPVTDGLLARSDVEVIEVSPSNRDELPRALARRLGVMPAEG